MRVTFDLVCVGRFSGSGAGDNETVAVEHLSRFRRFNNVHVRGDSMRAEMQGTFSYKNHRDERLCYSLERNLH